MTYRLVITLMCLSIFIQFTRKEVMKHYCEYVNNFTNSMNILEKVIKKKPKFLNFLKRQMLQSGTQLSLQALLLKPIQQFPHYILFLQVNKGHSCSPCPQKNVHNFSLECPTIFFTCTIFI